MNIVTKIENWQLIRKQLANLSIGFIPTMGNLHAGHMSLCDRSKKENDVTVASIFVNPFQFNDKRDFDLYPRTIEQDVAILRNHHVNYLFLPDVKELFVDNYEIQVQEISMSKELEGEYRPHHFTGVMTIVLKLLNLIRPTHAYFGEKDYQQLLLIKKMVKALFLPIEIIGCATVRDHDDLALSSRNQRLSPPQRQKAAYFPILLRSKKNTKKIIEELEKLDFKVDYVVDKWQHRLGAIWIDDVRLIDNFSLDG